MSFFLVFFNVQQEAVRVYRQPGLLLKSVKCERLSRFTPLDLRRRHPKQGRGDCLSFPRPPAGVIKGWI